jgi:hypothetical protein
MASHGHLSTQPIVLIILGAMAVGTVLTMAMAAFGIPADDIGRVVGIDPKTLRKHYREELDLGETKANAQVAGFLFQCRPQWQRDRADFLA